MPLRRVGAVEERLSAHWHNKKTFFLIKNWFLTGGGGVVLLSHMQKTKLKNSSLHGSHLSIPPQVIQQYFLICQHLYHLEAPSLPTVKCPGQTMTQSTLRTRAAYQIHDRSRWALNSKRIAASIHPQGAVRANAQYHIKIKSILVIYCLYLAYQPLKGLLTQAFSMWKPKSGRWWWLWFLIWACRRIWLATWKLFPWTDSKNLL